MKYLKTLKTEHKFQLCMFRILSGMSYAELATLVEEEWGVHTTRQSIGNFFRSEEGAKLMDAAYEKLRSEFATEPLVEKSTRVLGLREQAMKIQGLLRTLPMDGEDWISFSQEFRQYMKQIATEMEGIQVNVNDGKSAIEAAMEAAIAKQHRLEVVK